MPDMLHISVIGAGNVAWHLAPALQAAGYRVGGVYSRTLSNAENLAAQLPSAIATDDLSALPKSDAYIFSVSDDVLPTLARRLLGLLGTDTPCLFVHTAGSVPLSVFEVRNAAVIYPMMTFSKARAVDFRKVPLFVETSSAQSERMVAEMAHRLSGNVRGLDSEHRRMLHLSAVFACNFANHCFALAYRLLRSSGIEPDCLLPLIDETVAKIHELEPSEAQTGPAVRQDRTVMNRQLDTLSDFPELQAVYGLLSESIGREARL